MTNISIPRTFWVIGIVALLWNLMGLASFFAQVMMSADVLASLPEEQQEMYINTPIWLKAVHGIATVGGCLACVGLLLKKKWSMPLFMISLIAIVLQMGYSIFFTDASEILGAAQAYVIPILVIGIGVFLWYYSKSANAKGWLS